MRKYTMIICLVTAGLFWLPLTVKSQNQDSSATSESPWSISGDIMSRWVWRGRSYNSAPSIQPLLSYTKGGFSAGAWGAYTVSDASPFQEFDLYVSYTIKDLVTVTINDYFAPSEAVGNNNYFEYNGEKTAHFMEAMAAFNGTERIPITFTGAVLVYGADKEYTTNIFIDQTTFDTSITTTAKDLYSTYLELGYKRDNFSAFIGYVPNTKANFYGDHDGVVNLGMKYTNDVQITDKYALPIQASIITNPMEENVFLVFGFTIK